MESSALKLDRFKVVPKNHGSERGDALDQFLERLNPPRIAEGFKPLTHSRLSGLVAHIPTDELHAFYKACETASCGFSRCFWSRLKVK